MCVLHILLNVLKKNIQTLSHLPNCLQFLLHLLLTQKRSKMQRWDNVSTDSDIIITLIKE